MKVNTLSINNKSIMDEVGNIDWGLVVGAPLIIIEDNNHLHNDRYYTKSEVDSRISSLILAIDGLEEKVNNLFG